MSPHCGQKFPIHHGFDKIFDIYLNYYLLYLIRFARDKRDLYDQRILDIAYKQGIPLGTKPKGDNRKNLTTLWGRLKAYRYFVSNPDAEYFGVKITSEGYVPEKRQHEFLSGLRVSEDTIMIDEDMHQASIDLLRLFNLTLGTFRYKVGWTDIDFEFE